MRRLRLRGAALACLATLVVGGCVVQGPAGPSTPSDELTVFAAASLAKPLEAVRSSYIHGSDQVGLVVSTDSSAALEAKLEQGAPADVFLSADTANPAKLVAAGLAAGPPAPFAGNALTIVVPASNPGRVVIPADLARPGVKVVAAGASVPITRYADQLVANLARQSGYPPDFAARYDANVVSREDNVAAVLSKVALGEGDAAIVYVTDARTSTAVRSVDVPAAANVPATYTGVVLESSARRAAADAFLAWLAGPDGRAALEPFGFTAP